MTVCKDPSPQRPSHRGKVHALLGSFKFKSITLGLLTAGLTEFNYLYFIQSKMSLIVKGIIVSYIHKKGKMLTQCFLIT